MSAAWIESNQRELMGAVAGVRAALERAEERHPAEPVEEPDRSSALAVVADLFGLTRFERDVLLLAAAVELDGHVAEACARAHGDTSRRYPTFGLALALFPDAHWSALVPAAPLRRWRLVEIEGPSVTASPLRISERVLHFLAGVDHLDEEVAALTTAAGDLGPLPPSQARVASRAADLLNGDEPVVVQLCGPDPASRRAVAAGAGAVLERRVLELPAELVSGAADEQDSLARLFARELTLGGALLLVECAGLEDGELSRQAAADRFVDRLPGPVLVSARDPLRQLARLAVRLDVGKPTTAEQRALWAALLAPAGAALNGAVEGLVSHFDLDARTIRATAKQALADGDQTGSIARRVWEICRRHARPKLDDLAHRIEPAATWDDLVLPARERETLSEIAVHVRHRLRVYETWGFAERSSRGLGIAALFAGPSGTGKTLAAEVLANELRLDLYRIDLSSVVSKYIGETEKNLRRLFDAAEGSGAILVFDEADALFGKRTEVRDSHDRYANIEVSYLLQRMEAYRGLAILTTNQENALDSAFMRRIRFVVRFPFPDVAERREIWRRLFPSAAPVLELDVDRLARLSVSGGSIRNIGLNAAFLAAEADDGLRMSHVERAARSEYAKLEQPLTELEAGEGT